MCDELKEYARKVNMREWMVEEHFLRRMINRCRRRNENLCR